MACTIAMAVVSTFCEALPPVVTVKSVPATISSGVAGPVMTSLSLAARPLVPPTASSLKLNSCGWVVQASHSRSLCSTTSSAIGGGWLAFWMPSPAFGDV